MKRLILIGCCLAVTSILTAEMNPELIRFWNMIGQGYETNDMESLVVFHGSDYEIVMLENPLPDVDEEDKVWKIVYPGAEFYFYGFHGNTHRRLISWILTPEFELPAPYESLFGMSLQEIRRRFGREYRWFSETIAAHGVPAGASLQFHYNDEQKLEKIVWSTDAFW